MFYFCSMAKKKKKYYVVWRGLQPGIYENWQDCQAQIKGYPHASFKSFLSREAAQKAFEAGENSFQTTVKNKLEKPQIDPKEQSLLREKEVLPNSWAVDAACSGNPGPMEYRAVHLADHTELFHKEFPLGTNNIGEFLAIVHALALAKTTDNEHIPIYTDSALALNWVKKGRCKTTLASTPETEQLFKVIQRAEDWLSKNKWKNPLLKWDTSRWGEIPADFGRKSK